MARAAAPRSIRRELLWVLLTSVAVTWVATTIVSYLDTRHELDELLGAYALDAVDDAERRRVADYLEVNPRAAAEVQMHRETATMLAFTGMDAPDDLWGRIADEIAEQAPPPGPELAKVLSRERLVKAT